MQPAALCPAPDAGTTRPQSAPAAPRVQALPEAQAAGVVVAGEADAARQGSAGLDDRPWIARLPPELLQLILGQLPLAAHGACALVCRRWYSLLPDIRLRLALHLEQLAPCLRETVCHLTDGYSSRIRVWLQAGRSPFFLALERQHQALLQEQERFRQRGPEEVEPVAVMQPLMEQRLQTLARQLSVLACYSLYQQQVQARQLWLRPAAVEGSPRIFAFVNFSWCSQWMATAAPQEGAEPGFLQLRVYGWGQGRWQRQRLEPGSGRVPPVSMYTFSLCRSGALVSGHLGGLVIRWLRNPDTGYWEGSQVTDINGSVLVFPLPQSRDAGLALLCHGVDNGRQRLLLTHESREGQHWAPIIDKEYAAGDLFRFSWTYRQLAVVTAVPQVEHARGIVHIWERSRENGRPGDWRCQQTRLKKGQRVLHLSYSPDEKHLLGFLADSRACLWALDDRRKLCPRLDVACVFATSTRDLLAQRPFSNAGTRLVLALSHQLLQFWSRQDSGQWQADGRLVLESAPEEAADNPVRYLLFSSSDRTLLCVTGQYVDIWQQGGEHWQRLFRHRTDPAATVPPHAWRLPLQLYATAAGQPPELWMYGTDGEGRLVRKAVFAAEQPIARLTCSTDGLFLLVFYAHGAPPSQLQLMVRPEDVSGGHHDGAI